MTKTPATPVAQSTTVKNVAKRSVELVDVVAAVIERRGRLLLAQRPTQKAHGGLWEFPGGKVDPNEGLTVALQRELQEELALGPVEVGMELGVQVDASVRLRFFSVVTESAPIAVEHMALGWFQPLEARTLDLAPLDRAFLTAFKL